MSDEFDEFDDLGLDALDESTLRHLDVIEQQASVSIRPAQPPAHSGSSSDIEDLFDYDLDDSILRGIDELDSQLSGQGSVNPLAPSSNPADKAEAAAKFATPSRANGPSFPAQSRPAAPANWCTQPAQRNAKAGPSSKPAISGLGMKRTFSRTSSNVSAGDSAVQSSGGRRQMTLFGEAVPAATPARIPTQTPGHLSLSSQVPAGSNGTRKAPTKQWDRTAYAKSSKMSKGISKARDRNEFGAVIHLNSQDEDMSEVQEDWDAKLAWKNKAIPQPVPEELPPLRPMKQQIDREAAKTWIYPTNLPKRDYQFNIVQKALFNNVLVALPTGLGKTFIAAVVILNYFRWYPEGKIIFMAPTRPLVDQQKIACHGICGLPWDIAIDLTGSTSSKLRGNHWETKRIFYMTPQTLENDLKSKSCDPRDVVCIIVDEAHRATGKYAYGNVVSHLMQSNPHFRVLALSATPGSTSERVQEVIDQLHIGQIEIRTEEALDIRKYVHRKHEDIIRVPLGKDLNRIKNNWGKLMKTYMDPLINAGLLYQKDPVLLHPYSVSSLGRERKYWHVLNDRPHLRSNIKELSHMALSMQYLVEQSVMMFYHRLTELAVGSNSNGKKAATKRQQTFATTNSTFREILRELELLQDERGRVVHPKMDKLKEMVQEHFTKHEIAKMEAQEAMEHSGMAIDGQAPSTQHETRVMVFCSYRECVNEIVEHLNRAGLRATPFVGQSKDKNGNKGMTQKDQERVIRQFKDGEFNVLVATSIGEEGLDIGEVDITVCYEAVKDSVRMLQRVGRTGRKREGKIIVLMSEGREELNWKQSKESYRSVQKDINSGLTVELYDDIDRMVPPDLSPQPELKSVEQPEFEPSMVSDGKQPSRTTAKKKRNSDPARNVPKGGLMGFFKASDFAHKKRKRNALDSDDSDEEAAKARRQKLLTPSDEETDSADERLAKGLTFGSKTKSSPQNSKKTADEATSSTPLADLKPSSAKLGSTADTGIKSNAATLGYSSADPNKLSGSTRRRLGTHRSGLATTSSAKVESSAKLVRKTRKTIRQDSSSPVLATAPSSSMDIDDEFGTGSFALDSGMERLINGVEHGLPVSPSSTRRNSGKKTKTTAQTDSSDPPLPSSPLMQLRRDPHPLIAAAMARDYLDIGDWPYSEDLPSSPRATSTATKIESLAIDSDDDLEMNADDSVAVAPPKRKRGAAKRVLPTSSQSSPQSKAPAKMGPPDSMPRRKYGKAVDTQQSPVAARTSRLRRGKQTSPDDKGKGKTAEKPKPSKKKRIGGSPTSRALFMHEADRSTDEEVHGERDEHDEGVDSDDENDDDRAAVGMFEPTQAPRGYNQESIYMKSLLTQAAPSPFKKANRAPFPGVGGRFGLRSTPKPDRRRAIPSSESRRAAEDSDDRYSMDSFCVNDEEIEWDHSQSDDLPDRSSQF